jgi:hypothetical protein
MMFLHDIVLMIMIFYFFFGVVNHIKVLLKVGSIFT